MHAINNLMLPAITIMFAALSSGAAQASGVQPAEVPEPGLFGIAAAGTVAILLLVRLRQKK